VVGAATKVVATRVKLLVTAEKLRVVEDEYIGTQSYCSAAKIEMHGMATVVVRASEKLRRLLAHMAVGPGEPMCVAPQTDASTA
jgi:hypothetical protein